MPERNKIQINVDGEEFCIIADETEEYVKNVADFVNTKFNEVSKHNILNRHTKNILVLMNVADDLFKEKKVTSKMKSQEAENKLLQLEIKKLQTENQKFREQLNKKTEQKNKRNEDVKINDDVKINNF